MRPGEPSKLALSPLAVSPPIDFLWLYIMQNPHHRIELRRAFELSVKKLLSQYVIWQHYGATFL